MSEYVGWATGPWGDSVHWWSNGRTPCSIHSEPGDFVAEPQVNVKDVCPKCVKAVQEARWVLGIS